MSTLATLSVRLIADASKFHDEMGRAESRTGKFLSGIGRNVQAVGNLALAGLGTLAGAASMAGAALAKLAVDAAQIEGVRLAFEGLAASAGRSADELLAALEAGSGGMIAQRDLMKSYNLAAQLVSNDFAATLPDAMQYFSKVAAATGQDVNFLMESYVRGVGRLSPMILDNLAVQVDLNAAYEAYAMKIGKATSELTKQEQQMAVAEATLAQLAANTAAMPDVTETAAAKMARFQATLQNVKDQIGTALLPVLNTLLGTFGRLLERVLPPVVEFIEGSLVPVLERAASFIDAFVAALLAGQDPIEALKGALRGVGLDQVADGIERVMRYIGDLWSVIGPFVDEIFTWLVSNVKLEDILLAVGVAIGSVVVPALWSAITAAAPVIATFLAMVGVFVLLRTIWEQVWAQLEPVVMQAWEIIQPVLLQLWEWLRTEIPNALLRLQGWFEDVWGRVVPIVEEGAAQIQSKLQELLPIWQEIGGGVMAAGQALVSWVVENWPMIEETITQVMGVIADVIVEFVSTYITMAVEGYALLVDWIVANWPMIRDTAIEVFNAVVLALQTVWAFIQESVIPVLQTLWAWLAENVPVAIAKLREYWETILLPILQIVWDYIQTWIIPLFERLASIAITVLGTAINVLATFWETILLPALQMVWAFIQDSVVPLLSALANLVEVVVTKAVEVLAGVWQNVLKPALEEVWEFIDANIIPVFEDVMKTINDDVKPVLEDLASKVLPPIQGAFEQIGEAINTVIDYINDLAGKIENMELPDWLKPGSPPPLYYALMDIGTAMDMLSSRRLPAFAGGMASLDTAAIPVVDTMGGVTRAAVGGSVPAGGAGPVTLYGPVHVYGVQDAKGLIEELQDLAG